MQPRENERERLTRAVLWGLQPQEVHDTGVRIVSAEAPPGDAGADDVDDQEGRQRQPEPVLGGFPERHAQRSPLVQEPQRQ